MRENMMEQDVIEERNGALVQHGPKGGRAYLMKLGDADPAATAEDLLALARESGYGKVFAKVPESKAAPFVERGYECEAVVPGFYGGREAAHFLGAYLEEDRRRIVDEAIVRTTLEQARERAVAEPMPTRIPPGFFVAPCRPYDCREMSELYRAVFPSYPFPIGDPEYLAQTMSTHVQYFGVRSGGRLAALASAECDLDNLVVEMTDFATLPPFRGLGLASHLLWQMEEAMSRQGFLTAYTIARAASPGMNLTFARRGFRFAGMLPGNTPISGRIETMNVWWKPMAPP